MRSGEHALWDAYVATAPARADLAQFRAALRRAHAAVAPVIRAFGIAAREAAAVSQAYGRAYGVPAREAAAVSRAFGRAYGVPAREAAASMHRTVAALERSAARGPFGVPVVTSERMPDDAVVIVTPPDPDGGSDA